MSTRPTDLQQAHAADPYAEPAMLSVSVSVAQPNDAEYRAFQEMVGAARYNERPLNLQAELTLTQRELDTPSARVLKPKPAYYAPDPEIKGPIDFEAHLDLLESLMRHIEAITGWAVLTKHYPENIPLAKRHRLYQLAAGQWLTASPSNPCVAAFNFPNGTAEIISQLQAQNIDLSDLFPNIEKSAGDPAATGAILKEYLDPPPAPDQEPASFGMLQYPDPEKPPRRCLYALTEDDVISEYEERIQLRAEEIANGDQVPPLPPWDQLSPALQNRILQSAAKAFESIDNWDCINDAVHDLVALVDQQSGNTAAPPATG